MEANMENRRGFLLTIGGATAAFAAWRFTNGGDLMVTTAEAFEVTKSEADWRAQLTPAQFNVLRQHGTERAGTSPLNKEKRKGTFACAGCDLPLFSSDTKFESGTGWPSFYKPLDNAVDTQR